MEEEVKKIKVFSADNIRLIVQAMNELNLKKEDIISIIPEKGQYIIIYEK